MNDKLQAIKENLIKGECLLRQFDLEGLEKYNPYLDDLIDVRKEKIEKMLNEIELLRNEVEAIKEIKIDREKEILRLKNEDTKFIIEITENKKVRNYNSPKGYCYKLYITLKEVTLNNEPIKDVSSYALSFSERVKERNYRVLQWIQNYNIKEIYTNVNIDKFIKENKLNEILINNK